MLPVERCCVVDNANVQCPRRTNGNECCELHSTKTEMNGLDWKPCARGVCPECINKLGHLLTSRCSLFVTTGNLVRTYKLVEVEVYATNTEHPDPFTHCHPDQLLDRCWYFHRSSRSSNAAHREGTYKGLDLTLGSIDSQLYLGVLIRSVATASGTVINGPCLVVEELLRVFGCDTVRVCVEKLTSAHPLTLSHPNLSLSVDNDVPVTPPLSSPRVGLNIKVGVSGSEEYRWARYRFVSPSYVSLVKKGMELTIGALLLDGRDESVVAQLTGVKGTRVTRFKGVVAGKVDDLTKTEELVRDYSRFVNS